MRDRYFLDVVAKSLGRTVEWVRAHDGPHRCVDNRHYTYSCLVAEPSCHDAVLSDLNDSGERSAAWQWGEAGRPDARVREVARRDLAMCSSVLVTSAYKLAENLLAEELPRRWAHSRGVYEQARVHAQRWVDDETLHAVFVAAAVLHDIGYADQLADTGHHAADGARYLNGLGYDPTVVGLVAWHSTGQWELPLLGIDLHSVAPPPKNQMLRDLLWMADFTTSPDGEQVTPTERVADIRDRYAPDSTPVQAIDDSAAEFDRVLATYQMSVTDSRCSTTAGKFEEREES